MLVVIEGFDGSGKSTVAEAVAALFSDSDIITFPRDEGYTGPAIRAYLREQWRIEEKTAGRILDANGQPVKPGPNLGALAFQCMQIANRMEIMDELRAAEHRYGAVTFLVRYWQSALVYGHLDGLDEHWLVAVHENMQQARLNILLDIEPEEAIARRAARDGATPPERYEGKLERATKIVDLYRQTWKEAQQGYEEGNKQIGRHVVVDANGTFNQVVAEVFSLVRKEGAHPV